MIMKDIFLKNKGQRIPNISSNVKSDLKLNKTFDIREKRISSNFQILDKFEDEYIAGPGFYQISTSIGMPSNIFPIRNAPSYSIGKQSKPSNSFINKSFDVIKSINIPLNPEKLNCLWKSPSFSFPKSRKFFELKNHKCRNFYYSSENERIKNIGASFSKSQRFSTIEVKQNSVLPGPSQYVTEMNKSISEIISKYPKKTIGNQLRYKLSNEKLAHPSPFSYSIPSTFQKKGNVFPKAKREAIKVQLPGPQDYKIPNSSFYKNKKSPRFIFPKASLSYNYKKLKGINRFYLHNFKNS